MANLLTSPVGTLNFLAHLKPRENNYTGNMEYSARIEIDANSAEGAEFLKTIRKVNRNLGSDEKVSQEGNVFINAKSKNKPKVLDAQGNVLAEDKVPMIESGTVKLIVSTFQGKKGGGISLEAIQLVDIVEFTGSATQIDEDALAAAVRNA